VDWIHLAWDDNEPWVLKSAGIFLGFFFFCGVVRVRGARIRLHLLRHRLEKSYSFMVWFCSCWLKYYSFLAFSTFCAHWHCFVQYVLINCNVKGRNVVQVLCVLH